MAAPLDGRDEHGDRTGTRLYFGSAIVPVTDPRSGRPTFGFPFRWLPGTHAMDSGGLLRAARSKLENGTARD